MVRKARADGDSVTEILAGGLAEIMRRAREN